jgi:hypothetical protein
MYTPTNPQALKHLKVEIESFINEIQPDFLEFVIENFVKRERMYHQSQGGYLYDYCSIKNFRMFT